MSKGSDSQNGHEDQVNLSECTSPSNNSYEDGSRSTPSNLPKAATRQRKKKPSESEDEEFVAEEEVTSKKWLLKKGQAAAAATKPGMKKKAPAKRKPMSKLEKHSSDEEEEEEEPAAPSPKTQKLMGDAISSGAAPSKPKSAPKPTTQAQASKPSTPKRSTRNISAAKKNKAPVPEVQEEDEEPQGLLAKMSKASDSQNRSEEQVNLSEDSSPSSSYDDGSRSTPSNLPKASTRQRKKRNSDSEDEDFVADEATSKKRVMKKEYVAAANKPGLKQKQHARRISNVKA
nr:nucleolar and coiled-body phosphoprotein 1-like [Aegilops tauschii subsp. strangulata]